MKTPYKPISIMKFICILVIICFISNGFNIPRIQAQEFLLPTPGVLVRLSPPVNPPILKGIKVHPDNPLRFDFILDKGDSFLESKLSPNTNQPMSSPNASVGDLKEESTKLIKYFLASLTIPEQDLWVNLSPYEKDRIIPQSFGLTEMGRDLLAEDYMLKQITASLIYPEDELGKKFWKRIYEKAQKKYGTTNIPVNTFNKVWIVPAKAVVYENKKIGTAYVLEAKLKVMLEQDYLSLKNHNAINNISALGSQVVREIVIPELTKEVNEGKNFVQLRQVYNSLILAAWYKKKIKDSILDQVYLDRNKVSGVGHQSSTTVLAIYQRYLQAFKKGTYNYIKEDVDPLTQVIIPKKYFSGGTSFSAKDLGPVTSEVYQLPATISNANNEEVDMSLGVSSKAMLIKHAIPLTGSGAVIETRLEDKDFYENQSRDFKVEEDAEGNLKAIGLTNKDIWPVDGSPLKEVNDKLLLLDEIKDVLKRPRDSKKPFTILDWGCGNSETIKELVVRLKAEGIENIRIIGYANAYYSSWKFFPLPGVRLILDTADNLFQYIKPGELDLIYSYHGLRHYAANSDHPRSAENYHAKLATLLQPDGIMLTKTEVNSDHIVTKDWPWIVKGEHTRKVWRRKGAETPAMIVNEASIGDPTVTFEHMLDEIVSSDFKPALDANDLEMTDSMAVHLIRTWSRRNAKLAYAYLHSRDLSSYYETTEDHNDLLNILLHVGQGIGLSLAEIKNILNTCTIVRSGYDTLIDQDYHLLMGISTLAQDLADVRMSIRGDHQRILDALKLRLNEPSLMNHFKSKLDIHQLAERIALSILTTHASNYYGIVKLKTGDTRLMILVDPLISLAEREVGNEQPGLYLDQIRQSEQYWETINLLVGKFKKDLLMQHEIDYRRFNQLASEVGHLIVDHYFPGAHSGPIHEFFDEVVSDQVVDQPPYPLAKMSRLMLEKFLEIKDWSTAEKDETLGKRRHFDERRIKFLVDQLAGDGVEDALRWQKNHYKILREYLEKDRSFYAHILGWGLKEWVLEHVVLGDRHRMLVLTGHFLRVYNGQNELFDDMNKFIDTFKILAKANPAQMISKKNKSEIVPANLFDYHFEMLFDFFGFDGLLRFLNFAGFNIEDIKAVKFGKVNGRDVFRMDITLNNDEVRTFYLKKRFKNPLTAKLAMKNDIGPGFIDLGKESKHRFVETKIQGMQIIPGNTSLENYADAMGLVKGLAYALGKMHGLGISHDDLTRKYGKEDQIEKFVPWQLYVQKGAKGWVVRFIDYNEARLLKRQTNNKMFEKEMVRFREAALNYVTVLDRRWLEGYVGLDKGKINEIFDQSYALGLKEITNKAMTSVAKIIRLDKEGLDYDYFSGRLSIESRELSKIGEGGQNIIFKDPRYGVVYRISKKNYVDSLGSRLCSYLGVSPEYLGEGSTSNGFRFIKMKWVNGKSLEKIEGGLSKQQVEKFKKFLKRMIDSNVWLQDFAPQQFMEINDSGEFTLVDTDHVQEGLSGSEDEKYHHLLRYIRNIEDHFSIIWMNGVGTNPWELWNKADPNGLIKAYLQDLIKVFQFKIHSDSIWEQVDHDVPGIINDPDLRQQAINKIELGLRSETKGYALVSFLQDNKSFSSYFERIQEMVAQELGDLEAIQRARKESKENVLITQNALYQLRPHITLEANVMENWSQRDVAFDGLKRSVHEMTAINATVKGPHLMKDFGVTIQLETNDAQFAQLRERHHQQAMERNNFAVLPALLSSSVAYIRSSDPVELNRVNWILTAARSSPRDIPLKINKLSLIEGIFGKKLFLQESQSMKLPDEAMGININKKPADNSIGGIDLTPSKLNLQTKVMNDTGMLVGGDKVGIKFHLTPHMLQELKDAPGFTPMIINMHPLRDVKTFLDSR